MKSLFASEDIAALVAAFPPPAPSTRQPSLVRSVNDDTFLDSRSVVAQFRELVQFSESRVEISELARRLDISEADWLVDPGDQALYHSQDRRSLVPDGEIQELEKLIRDAEYVDLNRFSKGHRLALQTVDILLQRILSADPDAFRVLEDHKEFVYRTTYAQKVKIAISRLLSNSEDAAPRIIDVGAELSLSALPMQFVRQMTEGVLAEQSESEIGRIEQHGSRILYVPVNYGDLENRRRRQDYEDQVNSLIDQISRAGYCILPEKSSAASLSTMREDVTLLYAKNRSDNQDLILVGETGSPMPRLSMLSTPHTLRGQLEAIDRSAEMQIKGSWSTHRDSKKESVIVDDTLQTAGHDSKVPPECVTILLSSPSHMDPLRKRLMTRIQEVEQADVERFRHLVQQNLLSEIDLYTSGHATITDSTLQSNLEDYLGEELRRYIVPEAIALFRTQAHLLNKSRTRDLDKFQQAIYDAKGFKDIQAATAKFAKRQKIDSPSSAMLHTIKLKSFKQELQLMRKNTTGSFLLQHLTWILLSLATQRSAGTVEAKFMSAGKDTTRMIRQYQAIGDAEVGKQLMQWRDLLKIGSESAQDLQEMRARAEQAVREMEVEAEGSGNV